MMYGHMSMYGGTQMRKKSHVSLAKYIVRSTSDTDLKKHRFSFYLGSILPDLKPSFLYRRHEITGTFQDVKIAIDQLVNGKKDRPAKNKQRYYLNLGQITHYVADYFTFPHNRNYPGGFRDHCAYEKKLKRNLRSFLKTKEVGKLHTGKVEFHTPEALYEFIEKQHENYLQQKINVEEDIHHIVAVNHRMVEGITDLFHRSKDRQKLKKS